MKKKVFIIILLCLFIIIGLFLFISWNNRVVSTITLDINPSIKINFDRHKLVKSVEAINDDAKDIINNDLKRKNIDDCINVITNNLIDKGYAEDKQIFILLYVTGDITNSDIENKLINSFGEKEIHSEIIVIDDVTEKDRELANKNNIGLAKASYINSILVDNENINVKDLLTRPVEELTETKKTGKYCEDGYFLEGDFCLKEIGRKKASNGMVCPQGYYEFRNKCYKETLSEETNNLLCRDDFNLNESKCHRVITINAEPSKYTCSKGVAKTRAEINLTPLNAGDANDIVCVDYSSATHPVTPCELPANDPTERMSYGGRCYWHRAPVLPEGCPGKLKVNGACWDDATNIYICAGYRDGKQYKSKDEYCEHSIKYIEPTVTEYKCEVGFILNGNKCEKEEIEDAMHERICPSNYALVDNAKCINYNKTIDKENGYVCEEDFRLKKDMCIKYERIEAKHE